MMRRAVLTLVLGGALSAAVAAQVFRADADMVLLSVTVSDSQGRLMPGLDRTSFGVFEDGQLQEISLFANDPQPIAISLLVDASTSMEQQLTFAQEAAIGFAKRLRQQDIAQILDFNSETHIRQTFTNDAQLLERAIRQIRTAGSTSLYNALYIALSEQARAHEEANGAVRRQAIVLLSDGDDTTSLLTYDDVLEMAKRTNVAVYAIGLREGRSHSSRTEFQNADFVLRTLSQVTGGRVYFVQQISELARVYEQISDELSSQYVIGYVSKNTKRDGLWRQVAVRVTGQEGVARTKSGYFATASRR